MSQNRSKATLREEFIVCGAAGYPDPFHFDTLTDARRFALEHEFNHVKRARVAVTIRRRQTTEWEVVWMNNVALDADVKGKST